MGPPRARRGPCSVRQRHNLSPAHPWPSRSWNVLAGRSAWFAEHQQGCAHAPCRTRELSRVGGCSAAGHAPRRCLASVRSEQSGRWTLPFGHLAMGYQEQWLTWSWGMARLWNAPTSFDERLPSALSESLLLRMACRMHCLLFGSLRFALRPFPFCMWPDSSRSSLSCCLAPQ